MLKQVIAAFWIALKTVFCNCHTDQKQHHFLTQRHQYTVLRLARLSTVIGESSGLVFDSATQTLWTHNDGGSPAELFGLDATGQLQKTTPVALPNVDWEDLTRDPAGHLYIGDFGNNLNNRRNLTIYRLHPGRPRSIPSGSAMPIRPVFRPVRIRSTSIVRPFFTTPTACTCSAKTGAVDRYPYMRFPPNQVVLWPGGRGKSASTGW